jgi:RNA polymerase sigma-70 factor (ECF subfamily)
MFHNSPATLWPAVQPLIFQKYPCFDLAGMAHSVLTFNFERFRDDASSLPYRVSERRGADVDPVSVEASEVDREILDRLQQGDQSALHALFDKYLPALVRYADVTLGSTNGAQGDAGDIVSDVFTILWMRRSELDTVRNLRAYLYRAVRNRALNYRRSEQRTRAHREHFAQELGDSSTNTSRPDIELEDLEQQRLVWETVRTMREPMQQVAVLRWSHGLSFSEIAHILKISEASARVYASRALSILKRELPHLLR